MKILACPDLHLPHVDVAALSQFYLAVETEKPDVVVQLGDLYDMYSHSKFPRSSDLYTPKEEMAEARLGAENFWKNVKSSAGKRVRCIQILGNHDMRPSKRIQEKYPDIASLLGIDHLFKFPCVETILDTRCEFELDGIILTHGHYMRLGQHAEYYGKSVIHGHTHRPGVFFKKYHNKIIWELDCGHMADETAEPLQYTATKTTRWLKGYGKVEDGVPTFVPILT